MRIGLASTPFQVGAPSLGERIVLGLRDAAFLEFTVVTAWAKRSGLSRLKRDLAAFRARGGRVRAIVGIDEGGATQQGLLLIRSLSDEMSIFHDPRGGTFHPKLYVFKGNGAARIFIGSANLTRGGLYDNYELSVEIALELPRDVALLNEVEGWIGWLLEEPELCLAANDELMTKVIASRAVKDEDERRSETAAGDRTSPSVLLPFGRATARRVAAPSPSAEARPAGKPRETRPRHETAAPAQIERRWFKRLDRSGAQQPPRAGTNVTGVLRLTQAGLPIDWRTYFRDQLFGSASWRQRTVGGQPGEQASIPFEVTIDGQYLGAHRLGVSYARHREAGQANVTTVLHWGALGARLRAHEYTDYWVVISATTNGRFQLGIQRQRPNPGS